MKHFNSIKTFALAILLMIAPAVQRVNAQQPQQGLTLQAQTGIGAVLNASIAGTGGSTTAFYVLITNFVGGSIPSNVITINTVPATLNSTNFVSFVWLPVAGATSYDLLKLTSSALPTGSTSVGLHTALASTVTSSTDQGSGLASYTIANPPVNGQVNLYLNSRDHTTPQLAIDGLNGLNQPGIALGGKITDGWNLNRVKVDATATGVTLAANFIVNGTYLHAPTGSVNDTTDTAAAIIAALCTCTVGSVAGVQSGFRFSFINNSAGANTVTILAGTGVTFGSSVSPLTVAQNTVQNFIGTVTSCTTPAVKLYSIGNAVVY